MYVFVFVVVGLINFIHSFVDLGLVHALLPVYQQSPISSLFCSSSPLLSQSFQVRLTSGSPIYRNIGLARLPLYLPRFGVSDSALCQFFTSRTLHEIGPLLFTYHELLLGAFLFSNVHPLVPPLFNYQFFSLPRCRNCRTLILYS